MYQESMERDDFLTVASLLRQKPHAAARLTGDPDVPILRGVVRLYPMPRGVLMAVEVNHLPPGNLFELSIEGEIPLPSLLSVRGRTLQVMVVGACTVEDLMGRKVSFSACGSRRVLARGTIRP